MGFCNEVVFVDLRAEFSVGIDGEVRPPILKLGEKLKCLYCLEMCIFERNLSTTITNERPNLKTKLSYFSLDFFSSINYFLKGLGPQLFVSRFLYHKMMFIL